MKIRIIDNTTGKKILESPTIELEMEESVATPNWTKKLINQDTWQGHQFPLEQLSQLTENLPESASETERNDVVVQWAIGENTLEVDLSLVLAVLGRDKLILNPEQKNLAVTLE
jgi:primosomal protein N'